MKKANQSDSRDAGVAGSASTCTVDCNASIRWAISCGESWSLEISMACQSFSIFFWMIRLRGVARHGFALQIRLVVVNGNLDFIANRILSCRNIRQQTRLVELVDRPVQFAGRMVGNDQKFGTCKGIQVVGLCIFLGRIRKHVQ